MIEPSTPYILREAHAGYPAGTVLFKLAFHDYGLAGDDTRATGVQHVSMTTDPAGGYPGRTFPEALLAKPLDFVRAWAKRCYGTEDLTKELCITLSLLQGLMGTTNAPNGVTVRVFLDGSPNFLEAGPVELAAYIRRGEEAELHVFVEGKYVGGIRLQRGLGQKTIVSYGPYGGAEIFTILMQTGLQVAKALGEEPIQAPKADAKEEDSGITPEEQAAISSLRNKGHVVVIWSPEEIGNAHQGTLEDIAISRGNEYLADQNNENDEGPDDEPVEGYRR